MKKGMLLYSLIVNGILFIAIIVIIILQNLNYSWTGQNNYSFNNELINGQIILGLENGSHDISFKIDEETACKIGNIVLEKAVSKHSKIKLKTSLELGRGVNIYGKEEEFYIIKKEIKDITKSQVCTAISKDDGRIICVWVNPSE